MYLHCDRVIRKHLRNNRSDSVKIGYIIKQNNDNENTSKENTIVT